LYAAAFARVTALVSFDILAPAALPAAFAGEGGDGCRDAAFFAGAFFFAVAIKPQSV
jgi:hypothetical protein